MTESAKIEQRLAFTRENYRVMREKLLEILNWTEGAVCHDRSRVTAWKPQRPS